MTIPSIVSDQKTMAAALDQQSFVDDNRSTIGIPSDYGSPISAYSTHVVQTMKLAKTIALACLAMTAVLGLFVMLNSSRVCDCRYGETLETRSNPYFEPLVSSSENSAKVTGKGLPIRIQMEGDAGNLMRKNKKGKVNCSVERKTATQIIASEPKMLITPYGNITTDPRIIHMTGEKMIFTCSAGKSGKNMKDKGPKKFGTVINLNDLEKDEKLDTSSLTASASTTTSTTSESPLDRPKRSAPEEPPKDHHKKTHLNCDCHCPLEEN